MTTRTRPVSRRMLTVLCAAGLIAAACGDDGDEGNASDASSGDAADETFDSVRVVWSTEAAAYVPQSQGPWRFGPEYGLAQDEGDISQQPAASTAAQVLLAGGADVATGSMQVFVSARLEGHDLKIFCPIQGKITDEVVGVGDVDDFAQITDPDVVVAIDSPGGLINYVLNYILDTRDMGITVDDLTNVRVVEDGGLRLAALASGEADIAILDPFEKAQLVEERGEDDVHTLSIVAEDLDSVGFVYAASSEWLDENLDRAAAFCASVLRANAEALDDFDLYTDWSNEAIDPDPAPETLRVNWDRAVEYDIWPRDVSALAEELLVADLEMLVRSGMLDEEATSLTYDELVDSRPGAMAMELLSAG